MDDNFNVDCTPTVFAQKWMQRRHKYAPTELDFNAYAISTLLGQIRFRINEPYALP